MQLAEDGSRASDPSKSGFLSPGKAFALLFGVIVVLGGLIFLLRPDEPVRGSVTYPAGGEPPTFELTDAEAIARFEQLDLARRQIYEEKDPSLVDRVFTSFSPISTTVHDEVERLIDDRVTVETTFDTISLDVIENSTQEIRLRQVVVIEARFVNAKGEDVTKSSPERQTIEWTLRREGDRWLIHDALITDAQPIDG